MDAYDPSVRLMKKFGSSVTWTWCIQGISLLENAIVLPLFSIVGRQLIRPREITVGRIKPPSSLPEYSLPGRMYSSYLFCSSPSRTLEDHVGICS
jgi:hypothetical protein